MKTLSNPEKAFSYHLYGSGEDGLVTFVLSIPIAQLQAFIDYADQRKRVYLTPSRVHDPEYVQAGIDRERAFKIKVLSVFDDFMKKDITRNYAISLTNKTLKEKGFCNCTYEIAKNIINSSVNFRKTL